MRVGPENVEPVGYGVVFPAPSVKTPIYRVATSTLTPCCPLGNRCADMARRIGGSTVVHSSCFLDAPMIPPTRPPAAMPPTAPTPAATPSHPSRSADEYIIRPSTVRRSTHPGFHTSSPCPLGLFGAAEGCRSSRGGLP